MGLPNVAKYFTADAGALRRAARHDAARRRQDAGAETAQHRRDLVAAEIHATPRSADTLDAADDLLAARSVFQENADHLPWRGRLRGLRRFLVDELEPLNVALVLEDARNLHLQLRRGNIDTLVLRNDGIA